MHNIDRIDELIQEHCDDNVKQHNALSF